MTFEKLLQDVGEWHVKTFSDENINQRLYHKLEEEVHEFAGEVVAKELGFPDANPENEAADCLIVLLAWAFRNKVNLLEEAAKKLEIVKNRD